LSSAASGYGELLVDQQLGSTALPDLPAKPGLDIAAAVVSFDSMPEIVWRLTLLGYLYRGDHGDAGGHRFVVESSPDRLFDELRIGRHQPFELSNHSTMRSRLHLHGGWHYFCGSVDISQGRAAGQSNIRGGNDASREVEIPVLSSCVPLDFYAEVPWAAALPETE
jgi:hypothetical protein